MQDSSVASWALKDQGTEEAPSIPSELILFKVAWSHPALGSVNIPPDYAVGADQNGCRDEN